MADGYLERKAEEHEKQRAEQQKKKEIWLKNCK